MSIEVCLQLTHKEMAMCSTSTETCCVPRSRFPRQAQFPSSLALSSCRQLVEGVLSGRARPHRGSGWNPGPEERAGGLSTGHLRKRRPKNCFGREGAQEKEGPGHGGFLE